MCALLLLALRHRPRDLRAPSARVGRRVRGVPRRASPSRRGPPPRRRRPHYTRSYLADAPVAEAGRRKSRSSAYHGGRLTRPAAMSPESSRSALVREPRRPSSRQRARAISPPSEMWWRARHSYADDRLPCARNTPASCAGDAGRRPRRRAGLAGAASRARPRQRALGCYALSPSGEPWR